MYMAVFSSRLIQYNFLVELTSNIIKNTKCEALPINIMKCNIYSHYEYCVKQRSHRKQMPWIKETEFNLVFFRIDNENEKE